MTDIICEKCGSREIDVKDCLKKTNGSKNKQTNKRISYGIKFKKYTCACGHTWEI